MRTKLKISRKFCKNSFSNTAMGGNFQFLKTLRKIPIFASMNGIINCLPIWYLLNQSQQPKNKNNETSSMLTLKAPETLSGFFSVFIVNFE